MPLKNIEKSKLIVKFKFIKSYSGIGGLGEFSLVYKGSKIQLN